MRQGWKIRSGQRSFGGSDFGERRNERQAFRARPEIAQAGAGRGVRGEAVEERRRVFDADAVAGDQIGMGHGLVPPGAAAQDQKHAEYRDAGRARKSRGAGAPSRRRDPQRRDEEGDRRDPAALRDLLRVSGGAGRIPDRARILRQARRQEGGEEDKEVTARRAALSLAATLATLTPHAAAAADAYPARPIRFVVAFPPGGGTDIIARSIAHKLAERLAQQVVVDNRPGAGGNIGTDIVAKSAPDGYTVLMGSAGPLAINASLFAEMPFDPMRDLAPVTLAASTLNVLVVHPSLAAATVKELVALAKARPGAINFASSGHGTPAQLAGELFNVMAGVKMVHVPYKGAAPALTDLLSGQVQVMFSTMPPALPHIRDGKLRALAVTSLRRSGAMPGLPTVDEAALAGFEANTWHGVVVPAGTPAAVVAPLNPENGAVLHLAHVVQRLSSQGAEP